MSSPRSPSPSPTVTVTIPLDELLSPSEIARLDTYKNDCTKTFWLTRLISKRSSSTSSPPSPPTSTSTATSTATTNPISTPTPPEERTKKVQMPLAEYEAYWATDEEGRYVGTRPQGEGREVLRRRLWAELGLFGKSARTGRGERDRRVF
ncbi:MAG: hypothetical protein HETSPECPRED_007552 [Heterodermia speciosa]|uniref:Uncharacterized protein n=1 Tax=Heterodermia speciosa TaxID=116794 RepID=A0A8H3FW21_9LECA|nr:MAG: hypothetical protein HETSPECPRED_007552 [Heterodermia speciosa]